MNTFSLNEKSLQLFLVAMPSLSDAALLGGSFYTG
jgi:hypothetical protein